VSGNVSGEIDRIARNILCSKNLIYSVCDSAIAGLLGPNPRVGVVPRSPEAESFSGAISSFMDWLFLVNRMRRRSAVALMDAVLCKWTERALTALVVAALSSAAMWWGGPALRSMVVPEAVELPETPFDVMKAR
jgi:hypothetical protein